MVKTQLRLRSVLDPLVCRALVVTSESTHVVLRLYLGQLVGWLVDVTIQKPC